MFILFLISFTFFNDSFFSRVKHSWSSRNCLDLCAQLCDLAHQLHIPLLRSLGPQNQNAMSMTIGYPIMWCYVMLCDVAWHDSDGDSDSDTDNDTYIIIYIYNQTHIIFANTHLDLYLDLYKYTRYMNIIYIYIHDMLRVSQSIHDQWAGSMLIPTSGHQSKLLNQSNVLVLILAWNGLAS
jgi:hypothetical protein